jgi:hypothetical protein
MRRTRPTLVLAFLLSFSLTLAPLLPAFGEEEPEPASETLAVDQLGPPETPTLHGKLRLSATPWPWASRTT